MAHSIDLGRNIVMKDIRNVAEAKFKSSLFKADLAKEMEKLDDASFLRKPPQRDCWDAQCSVKAGTLSNYKVEELCTFVIFIFSEREKL